MLIAYRKDTGEILHYVDYGGNTKPTLFGLYHACIKKNYPNLKFEDIGEFIVDDKEKYNNDKTIKQMIYTHSKIKVEEENGKPKRLDFLESKKSDPPVKSESQILKEKIEKLEKIIGQQQDIIDYFIRPQGYVV